MKIAIVSDIHGNLPALEAVVADIRREGADRVVCLGDNLSGPLLPRETAQFLMATDWLVVAGNHERQLLACETTQGGASDAYAFSQLGAKELAWVASLPSTASPVAAVYLCHGTPLVDCEHLLETVRHGVLTLASAGEVQARLGAVQASLVACGHSHVPRCVRTQTGQVLLNPGSVGLQAYLDDHPEPYAVENGSPDARYALAEHHQGGWRVALRTVPYDAPAMARLAAQRGRQEWAKALLSGYVR